MASHTFRIQPRSVFVLCLPLPPYLPSLSNLDFPACVSARVSCSWLSAYHFMLLSPHFFITLCTVSYSFSAALPGSLLFIPWDTVREITFLQETFPYLLSGLWGHLCHYSYLFVIIAGSHQSEFLKATHFFFFAFLLPNWVVGTE